MSEHDDQDRKLLAAECAEKAGVKVDTWHGYVTRGQAPPADGRFGRTPWWWESTVDAWQAGRAGQGARTDLA